MKEEPARMESFLAVFNFQPFMPQFSALSLCPPGLERYLAAFGRTIKKIAEGRIRSNQVELG
jgi:hypothetical protein